jgi:hypothetical protein
MAAPDLRNLQFYLDRRPSMSENWQSVAGNMRIKAFTEWAQKRLQEGMGIEDVLSALREQGCTKIETTAALAMATSTSLEQAKRLVHLSETWKDSYETDEALHDVLERAGRQVQEIESQEGP